MAVEDTRQRLLAAAREVFAERGFEAATVRDICQQAEANLAAVNYYFGDKEGLYLAAVKSAHEQRTREVPLPEWPPGTPAAEKLHGFVQTMLARLITSSDPPWQVKLMLREVLQPTAACEELVRDFVRPHFELLLEILSELLPAETSERQRKMTAFSIVGQCVYYRVASRMLPLLLGPEEFASYRPAELAEHITNFSLSAIARVPHSAEEHA